MKENLHKIRVFQELNMRRPPDERIQVLLLYHKIHIDPLQRVVR